MTAIGAYCLPKNRGISLRRLHRNERSMYPNSIFVKSSPCPVENPLPSIPLPLEDSGLPPQGEEGAEWQSFRTSSPIGGGADSAPFSMKGVRERRRGVLQDILDSTANISDNTQTPKAHFPFLNYPLQPTAPFRSFSEEGQPTHYNLQPTTYSLLPYAYPSKLLRLCRRQDHSR